MNKRLPPPPDLRFSTIQSLVLQEVLFTNHHMQHILKIYIRSIWSGGRGGDFLLNCHIFVAHKISSMRSRISQLVSFILILYYSTGDIVSCVAYKFISKSPWNRLLDVMFVFVHNFAVKFDVFMSPLVDLFVHRYLCMFIS